MAEFRMPKIEFDQNDLARLSAIVERMEFAVGELAKQDKPTCDAEIEKLRDALAYILYQANDYTAPEFGRLAMIAQRARKTLYP